MHDPPTISLVTTGSRSAYLDIPAGATKLAVQIQPDTADGGWGSAVVGLEWTIDSEHWATLTNITFSSSVPARMGIPVTGAKMVRLACTTADVTADPQAEFLWMTA